MKGISFKEFSEISSDLICVISMDGTFHCTNPMFKKSTLDQAKLNFFEYVHHDDLEQTKKSLHKLSPDYPTINYETRFKMNTQESILVSWSATLNSDAGHIYQVGRNITKSSQEKNHFTQIYKTLMAHSIVAVTDVKGDIVEANEEFCKISGYTRSELIGRNHRILNSGVHSKQFFVDMWKNISSGKTWIGLIQNKRKNGDPYFVYSIISPLFDQHGKIENYLALRFDMTRHIQLKNELIKTTNILANTSSIAKIGGWELIVATGELNWTDETFHILEVEKVEGQKPILPEGLELFIPEHKLIVETAVKRAIEFGEPYSLEVQALTAKGNKLWVYTNGRANYINGEVATLSGTIQNINARKIAELNYEQERLKALQNAKLASLGELSAGVSHEIKNPLVVILGNLGQLKKFVNNEEKFDKKIELIKKSCERINTIATNLVKFSRSSSTIELAPTPLNKILEECLALAELKAKATGTKLTLECETNSQILCNEIQIEQVLINLLNNAMDAIKDLSDKWVHISSCDKEDMVFIYITDSGSGISKEIAEKLFEPFYSTKEVGEGTGLGLSISKGILDEHNASIKIDHENPNTCFVIEFPKYIA